MKRRYCCLVAVFLAALAVRLYHVTYPILDMHGFRQAQTASVIRNFYLSGIDVFHPAIDVAGEPGYLLLEFPLYQAIVAALYSLFFPTEIWARLVTIISGFLAAVYLYRLVSLLLNDFTATLSVVFFLFAPLNLFYHRAIMIDPLVVALSIMFLFYGSVYIDKRQRAAFWLAVLCGILSFVHKAPHAVTVLLPLLYFQLTRQKPLRLFDPAFLFLVVPACFLVAWQAYADAVNAKYEFSSYFVMSNPSFRRWNFGTLELRLNLSFYQRLGERLLFDVLAASALPLFLIGLFKRPDREPRWFFHLWLLSCLLNYLIFANLHYIHNYYQLSSIPPVAVFCGFGISAVYHWLERQLTVIKSGSLNRVFLGIGTLGVLWSAFFAPARFQINGLLLSALMLGTGLLAARLPMVFIMGLLAIFMWFASTTTLHSGYYRVKYDNVINGKMIRAVTRPDGLVVIARPGGDWDPGMMYYAERRGFVTDSSTLNLDLLRSFSQRGAKYIAVVEPDGESKARELLSPYPLLLSHGNLSIYRLSTTGRGEPKQPLKLD